MLSEVIWSPWVGLPPVVDPNLEVAVLVTSGITQPFKDASLRVFCLAKKVRCQLVGEDAPQILMDPSAFMLASVSMSEAKYQLWRNDIPYAAQVTDEQDYQ